MFVCACVCFRVYARVGASWVGRPICVSLCVPLRRVNIIYFLSTQEPGGRIRVDSNASLFSSQYAYNGKLTSVIDRLPRRLA